MGEKMKCRTVKKKLSPYQDGEVNPWEQEQIASHLADCQDCREQYAQLEKVRLTLAEIAEIRPDPWFCRQVVKKIKEPRAIRSWPTLRHVFSDLKNELLPN